MLFLLSYFCSVKMEHGFNFGQKNCYHKFLQRQTAAKSFNRRRELNPYYPIINLVVIPAKLPVSVLIYLKRNGALGLFRVDICAVEKGANLNA